MNGRIAWFHCRYRVAGEAGLASLPMQRLDRLARDDLPARLAEALDQALGADSAVYVIRRVEAAVTLDLADEPDDATIARRWAAGVAAAILEGIHDVGGGDAGGTSVVRFTDRTDQLACFVADLFAGTAWDRWYHGEFTHLRSASPPELLHTLLLDEDVVPMALLGRLHRASLLEPVLAALDPATVAALLAGTQGDAIAGEAARVPLAAAAELARQLGLWRGPPPEGQALYRSYLASGPPVVDWRDRSGLALAVADAVWFLVAAGWAHAPDRHDPALASRLGSSLAGLDWLDTDILRTALAGPSTSRWAVAGQPPTPPVRGVPAEPAGSRPGQPGTEAGQPATARSGPGPDRQGPHGTGPAPPTEPGTPPTDAGTPPAQPVHRPAEPGTPPGQPGTPPAQPAPHPAGPAAPPAGPGTPPAQPGTPPTQPGTPPAQPGTPWAGPGAPPTQPGTAPAQPGAPPAELGAPPAQPAPYPAGPGTPPSALPPQVIGPRPPPMLTPRQVELLQDLLSLIEGERVALDRRDPSSSANVLRLRAALAARTDRWSDDPMVTEVITRLVTTWAATHSARPSSPYAGAGSGATAPAPATGLGQLADQVAARLLGDLGDGSRPTWPASSYGGVFLLLRAVLDTRLAGVAGRLGYPTAAAPAPPGALLAALALRWAGQPVADDRPLDSALGLLAGLPEPPALPDLRQAFATGDHPGFQAALLEILDRHRLVSPSGDLHLHGVALGTGETALVAGDGTTRLWPLAMVPAPGADPAAPAGALAATWAAATGVRPDRLVCDHDLGTALRGRLDGLTVTPVPDQDETVGDDPDGILAVHRGSRQRLDALLGVLGNGQLGLPGADLTLALTAGALLRVWARWLQRFGGSSVPYLLEQFVRRSATVVADADQVVVELEPRPLDLVLEMAGYTAPLEGLPWLQGRRIVFRTGPP